MTEHNLASLLAAEREAAEFRAGKVAGEPAYEWSGKSAATGRPHYFGRLYEADAPCVWCGNEREHEWHVDRREVAKGDRVRASRLRAWHEHAGLLGTVDSAQVVLDEFGDYVRTMLLVHWDGEPENRYQSVDLREVDRVAD